MKSLPTVALAFALGALAPQSFHAQDLHIGAPASAISVTDMDGHLVTYEPHSGKPAVVIFFSTRCPISSAFNYRRNVLYNEFKDRVNFIIVNSNANESLEEIRNYARAMEFDSPVYRDDNNVMADRFGAQVTTDTFLFDSLGVLRYHGYLEDSPNATRAKVPALRLAIQAVLAGQPVAKPETKSFGCSIRRARL